jgi:hypothetical protein
VEDYRELLREIMEDEGDVVKVGAGNGRERGGCSVESGDEGDNGEGEEEGGKGATLFEAIINESNEVGMMKGKDDMFGVGIQSLQGLDDVRVAAKELKNLYANAKHIVFPLHHSNFITLIDNGLKQGCPLAAFLFSLALSPIISAFDRIAKPCPSIVRSYLDDLAFVFHDITTQLPRVMTTLVHFSAFTNLHVNFTKCIFVPLWPITLPDFTALLPTLKHKVFDSLIFMCLWLQIHWDFFPGFSSHPPNCAISFFS